MEKKCIFNKEINCTNCGECDICDLDKDKICDNCGKCLETPADKEYRTLDIDSILDEDSSESELEFEDELEIETHNTKMETNEFSDTESQEEWILIDDIPGLKEMLDENEIPRGYSEEFPGLMVFKKKG